LGEICFEKKLIFDQTFVALKASMIAIDPKYIIPAPMESWKDQGFEGILMLVNRRMFSAFFCYILLLFFGKKGEREGSKELLLLLGHRRHFRDARFIKIPSSPT
jgi:hypothetical protein